MAKGNVHFRYDGFYPVEADNEMHAGLLSALQMARHLQGPEGDASSATCMAARATFDAMIGVPSDENSCRATVPIQSCAEGRD
jgi:hypothetical protein